MSTNPSQPEGTGRTSRETTGSTAPSPPTVESNAMLKSMYEQATKLYMFFIALRLAVFVMTVLVQLGLLSTYFAFSLSAVVNPEKLHPAQQWIVVLTGMATLALAAAFEHRVFLLCHTLASRARSIERETGSGDHGVYHQLRKVKLGFGFMTHDRFFYGTYSVFLVVWVYLLVSTHVQFK